MKKYLSPSDKAGEIRLLLKHNMYKDKTIILVEGVSDKKLFRSLIREEFVEIEPVNGKSVLIPVMQDLHKSCSQKLFGVCDSDFDYLNGQPNKYEEIDIYMTDYHDSEMLLFNSNALNSFIDEFSSYENHSVISAELKRSVESIAYQLGIVRWVNDIHRMKLIFEGLDYGLFMDISKLSINLRLNDFINYLLARSKNKSLSASLDFILEESRRLDDLGHDVNHVANGHDVTAIISRIYSQAWVSVDRNLSKERVESCLRTSYHIDDFKKTQLFNKVDLALAKRLARA
ncbi:DUF4435 domain-containing protein [Pectobacterium versatile]|uniref:DUF4435 domain-containing protein n=1 Tax=Pectobacterium versatile TaxID=2488639 RepID=UPI001B362E36|nr:DUF4435 domain-containing protein [Pectobacterium versatile]MBQ4775294.1 DUF4435 domain-containing protein [Pectobacterium versatile]